MGPGETTGGGAGVAIGGVTGGAGTAGGASTIGGVAGGGLAVPFSPGDGLAWTSAGGGGVASAPVVPPNGSPLTRPAWIMAVADAGTVPRPSRAAPAPLPPLPGNAPGRNPGFAGISCPGLSRESGGAGGNPPAPEGETEWPCGGS